MDGRRKDLIDLSTRPSVYNIYILVLFIESFEHNASTLLEVMKTLVQRMITERDQQASHQGRPRIRIEEEQLRFFGGN